MRGERVTYGHVGSLIRRYRLRAKQTQAWVAWQLFQRGQPIDQGQVSQIEIGRRLPDMLLLAAFAHTLSIPREEVLMALGEEYDLARNR